VGWGRSMVAPFSWAVIVNGTAGGLVALVTSERSLSNRERGKAPTTVQYCTGDSSAACDRHQLPLQNLGDF
jgi:hypothetical protein